MSRKSKWPLRWGLVTFRQVREPDPPHWGWVTFVWHWEVVTFDPPC